MWPLATPGTAQLIGGTFPRWSAACRMSAPKTTPDKNVGERHPVSAGDKNVAPTPTKMSPTPRQKCHPEQYKNNNTRENNTRGGARERASGMFSGNPSRGMNG